MPLGRRSLRPCPSNRRSDVATTTDKDVNATNLLPVFTQSGGNLTLSFSALNAPNRGGAVLNVKQSSDLGILDAWVAAVVPETSGGPVNGVTYAVTSGSSTNGVAVKTPAASSSGSPLFLNPDVQKSYFGHRHSRPSSIIHPPSLRVPFQVRCWDLSFDVQLVRDPNSNYSPNSMVTNRRYSIVNPSLDSTRSNIANK